MDDDLKQLRQRVFDEARKLNSDEVWQLLQSLDYDMEVHNAEMLSVGRKLGMYEGLANTIALRFPALLDGEETLSLMEQTKLILILKEWFEFLKRNDGEYYDRMFRTRGKD